MRKFLLTLIGFNLLLACTAPLTVADGGRLYVGEGSKVTILTQGLVVKTGGRLDLGGEVAVNSGNAVLQGDVFVELRGPEDFGLLDIANRAETSDGQLTVTLAPDYEPATFTVHSWLLNDDGNDGPFDVENLPSDAFYTEYDAERGAVIFDVSLPVEWRYFRGQRQDKVSLLSWGTAGEDGADYYGVERLSPAGQWLEIGRVTANGQPGESTSYQFTDPAPGPTNPVLYRLRQTDLDGQFAYSEVVAIEFPSPSEQPSLYPNPTTGPLTFYTGNGINTAVEYHITDASGRIVHSGTIAAASNTLSLRMSSDFPKGVYLFRCGKVTLPFVLR